MNSATELENKYPGPRDIAGLYTGPIQWQHWAIQTVSFWQLMDYFGSHEFMKAIREVYAYELQLQERVNEGGDWNKELPEWNDKRTDELLEIVGKAFDHKEFPYLSKVTSNVAAFAGSKCTYQELYIRIVGLREAMENELTVRKLVHISTLKEACCDNDDLLGREVSEAFPSAITDIMEAGNSYAVGLNTACVFHLMRVLERGLRALAVDLSLNYKTEPWGGILKNVEDAIKALQAPNNHSSKKANLKFYSECAVEFRYIKDAWRNHVMHAESTYGEKEADKVMEHVRNFMQRLAERLSDVV
ncbi:MAG TPA: hypothetical protein VG028_02000 [Terriglobia bacterium]|nr:hypothetical protein [Terriglobia bacterium]